MMPRPDETLPPLEILLQGVAACQEMTLTAVGLAPGLVVRSKVIMPGRRPGNLSPLACRRIKGAASMAMAISGLAGPNLLPPGLLFQKTPYASRIEWARPELLIPDRHHCQSAPASS